MSAVLVDLDGPLATITLNRPAKLNAVDAALAADLAEQVDRVAAQPDVRVVLVRGAGRAFCSGIDRDMVAADAVPDDFFEVTERARLGLEGMDKITVAEVHGYCLGGGLQLAIACDIRIAAVDARMSLPAVSDALIPGMAPVRLPRLIGLGPARRLMLSGAEIGTEEAYRLGLVDHIVPADGRQAATDEVLRTYLAAPRTATVAVKALMARAFDPPVAAVAQEAAAMFTQCLATADLAAASDTWRDRRAARRPPSTAR